MLPKLEPRDCDDCVATALKDNAFGSRAAFSTIPFCATFILVTLIAYRKVFPLLAAVSTGSLAKSNTNKHAQQLPLPATANTEPAAQNLARRIAALTFSSTIALSAVLTELLLCEISNSFNPTARSVALQFTVASLLGLLVVAIPLLGISSVVSRSGYRFRAEQRNRRRLAWALELTGYAIFLIGFWFIGVLLPAEQEKSIRDTINDGRESLFQACLDRLGVTGVSLMALLSGFASVSAVWQTFGPQAALVTEADITKRETGLDALNGMIAESKSRLRQLERKMVEPSAQSFWSRTVASKFRGNPDTLEKQNLEVELTGLEMLSSNLESALSVAKSRRADQLRSSTKSGRLYLAFNYVFSCYCICRIATTFWAVGRRTIFARFLSLPSSAEADSPDTDPITSVLALIARYVYPSLNQQSWTQQISFLLSGVMLLASFSAVTQTFHLFSRFLPSLLHATKTNFALLISQISGMYVISSALMLRGMMPKEVGGVINSALGAGLLEPGWITRWFQGWFFFAVCLTVFGIWMGRKMSGPSAWDDGDAKTDEAGGTAGTGLGYGKQL